MAKHNHNAAVDKATLEKIVRQPKVRRAVTTACHFWFFHVYFSHYVKYQTAPFQKEMFRITENEKIKNVVIEAFRGSAKTAIMSTSYAVWSILGRQRKKFVLILAQTQEQARQYLASIKMELESNSLLRKDLGPFEEPDDEWRSASIVLPKYGARITVASIDKPVRGLRHGAHRPDLIICDDLEDLDTVRTQESRDKIFNWLTGDVIPLGDKMTRLVVIGTKLHDDSILSRIARAIQEGKMDGTVRSYPLLNLQGRPAWPGKYRDKNDIAELRKSVPSAVAWEREYMLRIIAEEEQVVRPEWIQYYDDLPDEAEMRFAAMAVDPAISESASADCTAMVSAKVYGHGDKLRIYILPNPVNERLSFPKSVERIKSVSRSLGDGRPTKVYVEGVAYQKSLIEQLTSEGIPAEEFLPKGSDKRERLSLTTHMVQSGKILFPKQGAERLISQLTGFGSERHDDLADAFAILVLKIQEVEAQIIAKHHPFLSQQELERAYIPDDITGDPFAFATAKRLGITVMGGARKYSVIVLRSDNLATVLFRGQAADIPFLAGRIMEYARGRGIAFDNWHVFIDRAGSGNELYKHLRNLDKEPCGVDFGSAPETDSKKFANLRTQCYERMAMWVKKGTKLIGRLAIEDLIHGAIYTELPNGKIKVRDKEKLTDIGIDVSAADALAVTFAKKEESDGWGPQQSSTPTRDAAAYW